MRFEYEVGIGEYVSGSLAYWKLIDRRSRFERGVLWTMAGATLIVTAWFGNPLVRSVLATVVGAWLIYEGGLRNFFPQSYLGRHYAVADLAGRKFTAEIDEHALQIETANWGWRVPWDGVRQKAENDRVFMIYSFGTMFILGKRYLGPEQQREIRRLLRM